MYSNDNLTLNFVTYSHSHLLYKFLCPFEDGVADFAFKTLFGHGYACCASDFLLSLCETDSTLPRECETWDFHFGEDYLFKKFFNEIVDIFNIFDFNCKPLSEVKIIGFSSLYFKATERIILSGDLLSKSSGNNDVSANS